MEFRNLISILAKIAFTWSLSMLWHLWRIATGRPDFHSISDTHITRNSFVLVFVAVSILRWELDRGQDWLFWLVNTAGHAGVLVFLSDKQGRSDSLLLSFMGAASVVSILAILTVALGIVPTTHSWAFNDWLPRSWAFDGLEVCLLLVCWWRFNQLPPEQQAAGFGADRIEPSESKPRKDNP